MNAMNQTTSANRAHLEAAVAAWNRGDLGAYLDLYDETILLHGYAPQPMNKPEVTGFYQLVHASLGGENGQPPTLEVDQVMEAGDRIAMRFVQKGVHRGPFLGFPPSGRPYVISGLTIMRFAQGRVIERWAAADMLGLLVQIGAVRLPAPA